MRAIVRRWPFGLLVGCTFGLLAGCGGQTVEPQPVPARIVLSQDSIKLRVGESVQLTAVVLDSAGSQITGAAVTFTTSDQAVAAVTAGGLVTGEGAGTAAITATTNPPVSAQLPAVIRRAPSLAVVASPAVAACPYGIALAANGTGYVTQFCGSTVTRFNVAGPTLTGTVSVDAQPPHVAISPDGSTAYVVNQIGHSVMVVDVATNTAVDTISLGAEEGYNLLVSPSGARVYVTTNGGTVYDMNAATHALEHSVQVGAAANGLALHPTAPTLYVSSILAATVSAINTSSFTVTRTYPVGGRLQRIAVAPSGTELYAANLSGLSILDLSSGSVSGIPLGSETIGLALDALGEYVYVSVPAEGRVAVIDLVERGLYGNIPTGGDPRNIAIGAGGTVLIANQSGWFDVVR
jgi:YVTN family beta-propeller protein